MKKLLKNSVILMIIVASICLIGILIMKKVNIISNDDTKLEAKTISLPKYIKIISEVKQGDGLWRPVIDNIEGLDGNAIVAYCTEPGASVNTKGYTIEQLNASIKSRSANNACAEEPTEMPIWSYTNSYFVADANEKIYNQDDVYTEGVYFSEDHTNLYDVGYIISYHDYTDRYNEEEWSGSVQHAIWRSGVDRIKLNTKKAHGYYSYYGIALSDESRWYQDFYENIVSRSSKEDPKMNPTDESIYDKTDTTNCVKTCVNQDTNTTIIGPYKVSYAQMKSDDVAADGGRINFGGISDMYLVDDAGNRIEITNLQTTNEHYYYADAYTPGDESSDYQKYVNLKWQYIMEERGDTTSSKYISFEDYLANAGLQKKTRTSGKPNYFSTDPGTGNENLNLVDYWDFIRYYPDSDENFYVGYDNSKNIVGSVHLKVEFSWLKCSGTFVLRDSYKYQLVLYRHEHTETDDDGDWSCSWATSSDEISTQAGILIISGNREIEKQELTLESPTPSSENEDTTMKLGGYVFRDNISGKESKTNGSLGDEDTRMANIKVTLYEYKDGLETEATCMTLLSTKYTIPNLDATQKESYKTDVTAAIGYAEAYIENLKQDNADGKNDSLIKGIEDTIEESKSSADYTRRTNPTLTDENGYYEFRGLDTSKKYIVRFTYNGQDYIPTDYLTYKDADTAGIIDSFDTVSNMVKAGYYSGDNDKSDDKQENTDWRITSKGTEYAHERVSYDSKFAEIGSSPHNYVSSNSLGYLTNMGDRYYEESKNEYYNETYTELDLMGCTLNSEGKYIYNPNQQLIDGYKYKINENNEVQVNENGNCELTNEYSEGIITQKIKQYIDQNKEYPSDDAMKSIYADIYETKFNNSAEALRKIQFIEDCKMNSWTKSPTTNDNSGQEGLALDTYPVYNQFTTNTTNETTPDGTTYKAIYKGQLEINQGLVQRTKADVSLQKDVWRAAVKINGKTGIYGYKTADPDDKYWNIDVRMSDYEAYYSPTYSRELYESDYNAVSNNQITNKLDVYVTYRIVVHNQSESVLTQIPEIVDYYDDDYTYRDDLSWVMYHDSPSDTKATITAGEYYNMMNSNDNLSTDTTGEAQKNITNYRAAYNKTNENYTRSKYGDNTREDIDTDSTSGYNAVYVNGLASKKLESGQSEYVYLTFEVNLDKDKNNMVKTGLKSNYAEINGYKTYYKDGTELPNGVTKNSGDTAGLIDVDSNPGNLTLSDLNGEKYEKNFEDDTDRAKTIDIKVIEDPSRTISGTVWEDKRTKTVELSTIGDGIRDNGESGISNVTVELYEIISSTEMRKCNIWTDGKWSPASTLTKDNGEYSFSGYIPGNYILKFTYGNGKTKYYNGQDYKSTIYDTDNLNTVYNTNKPDDNDDPSDSNYWYDLKKADAETNVERSKHLGSDARDIYGTTVKKYTRAYVDYYSNNGGNGVTNTLANALLKDTNNNNESEYNDNLEMTAKTAKIDIEVEYGRTNSQTQFDKDNETTGYQNEGNNDTSNYTTIGSYNIQNLDFGLTERPKSQLELLKQVTNVKVTLANGTTLFDATQKATNVMWIPTSQIAYQGYTKDEYFMNEPNLREVGLNKGKIQLTMDEELMQGATIKITYAMYVINTGEVNYKDNEFYYLGIENDTSSNIVTTTANTIIDYVGYQSDSSSNATRNNLKFNVSDNAEVWSVISDDDLNCLDNSVMNTAKSNYNTIIKTNSLKKDLVPIIYDYNKNKTLQDILNDTSDDSIKKNVQNYANSVQSSIVATTLVLSQTISSNNTSDDMTYNNMAEIISTNNTVGRRMAYSVVGNQDPTAEPAEADADDAQEVTILPPFGQKKYVYYILGATIVVILVAGIILIKKKILKK